MDEHRVILVTGSRKGIGRHVAEHYLKSGWRVIGCSRQAGVIEHDLYHHFCLDVSDEPAVIRLFSEIRRRFGRLDALINNAGVASMNSALLTPLAQVSGILQTNVLGTFLFSREAAKLMSLRNYGRIVNFTTVAVPYRLEGEAAYVASKSAVAGLTQVLAREFGALGITVNALGPTPIATDLIKSVPQNKIDSLVRRQAVKRLGKSDDVCNVLDFFLKPESDFITGQIIYLGGA
jgi:3-oxoacyl-[acyl-carrier protein] reductase